MVGSIGYSSGLLNRRRESGLQVRVLHHPPILIVIEANKYRKSLFSMQVKLFLYRNANFDDRTHGGIA